MFCAREIATLVAWTPMEPRIQNVSGFLLKGMLELLHWPQFYKIINNEMSQTQTTDNEWRLT